MFNIYPYLNLNDLNLDWIIKHFKEFIDAIKDLDDWRTQHEQEYEELKTMYDAIVSGNFPPEMLQALQTWVQENAIDLIGELVHTVFFEVNDAGYFVAWIPDSWADITFHTTEYDISLPIQPQYGHLVLSY